MKKLLLTAFAVSCAASVFAQGTVQFNNRLTGAITTYVYYNAAVSEQLRGNAANEFPAGTMDWTGFTRISGANYMAVLMGGPAGALESALSFGTTPQTTTFRTGTASGNVASYVATLSSLTPDAASATVSVFAWDTKGRTLIDPVAAYAGWKAGTVIGGTSGAFNVLNVGGAVNSPPVLTGWQSFNIYMVPEPSTMALAGLAAAGLLIFRRRK